jgi:hypothetical protein
MSFKRIIAMAATCLILPACNTARTHIGDEDPFVGEAVKYNSAMQTINPLPVYAADAAQPGGSGETGAAAVKRYRTDKVKEPQTTRTTTGVSGGSGGSGGPGGQR